MNSIAHLVLLGDVMLGRIVNDSFTAAEERMHKVWGNFLPYLQGKVDNVQTIVTGNLECAVTDHPHKWPKQFNFKLSPSNIETLKIANFRYVSLANNHILDYCLPGMNHTMETLQAAGIKYSGVGTAEESRQPALLHVGDDNDVKIGFLSYADHYTYWKATQEKHGINFIDPDNFDTARLRLDYEAARQQGADIVCVFIHWGPNWSWRPSGGITALGHAFLDVGVDVVFGHSSHHVQGIEVYKGRPIIYGAGGFIDDYALDPDFRNDLGFMYRLTLAGNKMQRLELIPSHIRHTFLERGSFPPYWSEVNVAEGQDKEWVCNKMKQLSKKMGTELQHLPEGRGLYIDLNGTSY